MAYPDKVYRTWDDFIAHPRNGVDFLIHEDKKEICVFRNHPNLPLSAGYLAETIIDAEGRYIKNRFGDTTSDWSLRPKMVT